MGQFKTPLELIGLYVPSGKGTFSDGNISVRHTGTSSRVKEVIMYTSAADGKGDPATPVAADIAGVDRIFKVEGAQATAATAYGTKSIPKVQRIVGLGGGCVIFIPYHEKLIIMLSFI